MEREATIRELNEKIMNLARLHILHGLHHTSGFRSHKEDVKNMIREHRVNVKSELDPQASLLYRRYFD